MSIRDQISEVEKRWYAVKCKFRCEKILMLEFNDLGMETYVPIQKKTRQYASGVKSSTVALIPSHIFVRINRSEYLPILQHYQVFHFLNFSGKLQAIPNREMQMMKRVVGEVDNVVISETVYEVGDEVQIIGGELTGLSGRLVDAGIHNLKIELTSLGMGLMINVDPVNLVKIGSRKSMVA